jgi:thymidylate synthase
LQSRLADAETSEEYLAVRDWLTETAPPEEREHYDHVPGLLEQLSREPRERPEIDVADVPLDELTFDDFQLQNYDPAPGIEFAVAE